MFEDAAKYHGNETIKIKDIAELLKDSIDLPVSNSNFKELASGSTDSEENDSTSEV